MLQRLPRRDVAFVGAMAFGLAAAFSVHAQLDTGARKIEDLFVSVTGFDYRFHFQHAGPDQRLDSGDDRHGVQDLHVPAGTRVHLDLTSRDFVYVFEIPELDIYEIVAPDVTFSVDFAAPPVGSYKLLGNQMCGYDHESLLGNLVVQSPSQYRQTVDQLASEPSFSEQEITR